MQTPPASTPPPSLLVLLRHLERSITIRLVDQLRAAGYPGLTPAHGKVFPFIGPHGSRVADMARAAQITKQSMTDLVDLLEQQGYVQRQPDPSDQRAKLVCLTRRGQQVVNTANNALKKAYAEIEMTIGADGLATLHHLLATIHDHTLPQTHGLAGASHADAAPTGRRSTPTPKAP
jgi:DNA-binding MarR family transcriptional regulator